MGLRVEFVEGVRRFVEHAKTLDAWSHFWAICCPCVRCDGFFKIASAGHNNYQDIRMIEMVHDAFGMQHGGDFRKNIEDVPNREVGRFYEQLHAASHPLFDGYSHLVCLFLQKKWAGRCLDVEDENVRSSSGPTFYLSSVYRETVESLKNTIFKLTEELAAYRKRAKQKEEEV
ncbi:hypothetical protein P3S67_030250 [Capsicum chacoense]